MTTWPATLPAPALGSFTEAPPDNTIRSQVDKGPAKTRRRSTAGTRPVAFIMKLLPAQVAILDAFYVTDTYSGSEEFDFTHPRTGAGVTARFIQPPQYSELEGVIYEASVSLEILP